MPWAPSGTLPGVPPHTSQGIGSALYLSSGGYVPVRAGALCLAVEAGYSFPDRSRAKGSRSWQSGDARTQCSTLVFQEPGPFVQSEGTQRCQS